MFFELQEPGQENKEIAIGIDLGTTNSLVAVYKDDKVEIIKGPDGSTLMPSVVLYDGDIIKVGEKDGIASIKRLMAKSKKDIGSMHLPFEIVSSENELIRLKVAGRTLTPTEISADILKALKKRAEDFIATTVNKAVITIPAYFDDAARAATKDAARIAGLEVLRLISEPTAAAIAYGLDEKEEGIYMVYDLGGGTFDVSIIKMYMGVFQVIATAGDTFLGGDDIDHAIEAYLYDKHGQKSAVPGRTIKENLDKYVTLLSKEEFNNIIRPYQERTIKICEKAIRDAAIATQDIKAIIMVGGSTKSHIIKQAVKDYFARPIMDHLNPEEVVVIGAAMRAYALTTKKGALLLDVTPLSLGIELMGGVVDKIITRNSPIPIIKKQVFTTHVNAQKSMKIHVLQGENDKVEECRSLTTIHLTDIPPLPAGEAKIEVTYALDTDGILTVSAQELSTGVKQVLEVKPSYGLTEEEIKRMIATKSVDHH